MGGYSLKYNDVSSSSSSSSSITEKGTLASSPPKSLPRSPTTMPAPISPRLAGNPLDWKKVAFAKKALHDVLSAPLDPSLLFSIYGQGVGGKLHVSMENDPLGRQRAKITSSSGVREIQATGAHASWRQRELAMAEKLLDDWATYGVEAFGEIWILVERDRVRCYVMTKAGLFQGQAGRPVSRTDVTMAQLYGKASW